MILLDIINLNDINFIEGQELSMTFLNNYDDISVNNDNNEDNNEYSNKDNDHYKNIFNKNIPKNDLIKKKIKIIKNIGEGSYGIVYKIKIDSIYYAFKINKNELCHKLKERYNSLIECDVLKKYIINIYVSGEISNNNNYKYFSIMEYGGDTLRNIYDNFNMSKTKLIVKQLFNIIHITAKYKFLMTDFKLSNITCNDDYKIKLIDIYMFCENYTPCTKCKIVRTYSTIEIEKEKRIYEDPNYNFTCTYIPFAICIVDLICKHLYKYKKNIEDEFPIVKNDDLYNYFVSLITIKHDFISKKKFILILNDLINLDPKQRSLKYLKNKLIG